MQLYCRNACPPAVLVFESWFSLSKIGFLEIGDIVTSESQEVKAGDIHVIQEIAPQVESLSRLIKRVRVLLRQVCRNSASSSMGNCGRPLLFSAVPVTSARTTVLRSGSR